MAFARRGNNYTITTTTTTTTTSNNNNDNNNDSNSNSNDNNIFTAWQQLQHVDITMVQACYAQSTLVSVCLHVR